jgi:hypothetical protein
MNRLIAMLVLFCAVADLAVGQSGLTQKAHPSQFWVDPSTQLMWTGKDNGKNVSWNGAVKYCVNLRLAGYSDWKLASMAQLQGIYDARAKAPGLAGRNGVEPFTWHVKGNLFLTGNEWSTQREYDDRWHFAGYSWYFDFNSGKPDKDQNGYSYFKRALCVREPR